jgi:hypothetical protein
MSAWQKGLAAAHAAPRCGAWGRQAQRPCRMAAMRGRTRCWAHGGHSTGPKPGSANALKDGRYSAAALAAKAQHVADERHARALVKAATKRAERVVKRRRKRPLSSS